MEVFKTNPKSPITIAIQKADEADKKAEISKKLRVAFPKMSRINALLQMPEVRNAVWNVFQFDEDIQLPTLGEDLLYGGLSDVYHNPGIWTVILSDMAPSNYYRYFIHLANYQNRPVKFYDEKSASLYRAKLSQEMDY